MSSPSPSDRAARGRALLAARARRIALLRRRVVAATLATFVLAWGAIAWHGSLGATSDAATAQVSSATATPTASSDDTTSTAPDLTTGQS